jgi:MscS family membrane protein
VALKLLQSARLRWFELQKMTEFRKAFLRRQAGIYLIVAATLAGPRLHAQGLLDIASLKGKEAAPEDPLNRLSPQSSVISFLEACQAGNFERAARYLDLDGLPRDQRASGGPELAQQLGKLLERDAQFDMAALSRSPQGDSSDGLPADRERVASYEVNGKTLELQLERKKPQAGLAVWIFSSDSVALIPQLLQITSDSVIEKHLPTVLVAWNFAGAPLWRWITFALLAIAVGSLSGRLARLAIALLRPLGRTMFPKFQAALFDPFVGPVQLLLAAVFLRAGVEWLRLPALQRLYLTRGCELLMIFGTAWFLNRTVDLIVEQVRLKLLARRSGLSRSILPLASRVVKTTVFVFAVTTVVGSWGYNTNTILAGLGIGGVAIALAAQKTIENLFGGVAVVSDRPVTVGDFCKFGDRVGTVEDIGLRSTRIRSLDRTLVSIPNSEFSSMVLENFSRRDKVWFHPTLNLRRDTQPDQLRQILDSIGHILGEHPKVEVGAFPVRFVGAGPYSLDIEIFAYIQTTDYDEFLRFQQDLLLRIMDAISAAGTALSTPAQVNVSYAESSAPQRPARAPNLVVAHNGSD